MRFSTSSDNMYMMVAKIGYTLFPRPKQVGLDDVK